MDFSKEPGHFSPLLLKYNKTNVFNITQQTFLLLEILIELFNTLN